MDPRGGGDRAEGRSERRQRQREQRECVEKLDEEVGRGRGRQTAEQLRVRADSFRIAADKSAARAQRDRDKAQGAEQVARVSADVAQRERDNADTQRRRAEKLGVEAISRQLATQAFSQLDSKHDLALLLSVEATRNDTTSEADSSLRTALQYSPQLEKIFRGHPSGVYSMAFSPDGTRLAFERSDENLRLWDVETGDSLKTFEGHTGDVLTMAFSPSGNRLRAGAPHHLVRRAA